MPLISSTGFADLLRLAQRVLPDLSMMKTRHLLVVEDDRDMREMLVSLFREEGFEVSGADSVNEVLERMRETDFDAVLSDIKMPGRSGIDLVGELRRIRPEVPVVLMTAFGSIDSAVEAMRVGAFDYITKPFEPEVLLFTVERALERRILEEENRHLRRAVDRVSSFGDLIGKSPEMREVFALIRRVSGNCSSVLITGESGTGKELVARTIHFHGGRAKRPFVPVNCTAIPEGLLESEVFGHVRGAFTGAHTSKEGLFKAADGGTLFLDEIGDMGLSLQGKLLRVLQDGTIRPVGSQQSLKVDTRIVAATNKDLEVEMAEGRFREDLFYRLNVIPVHIPPIRERPDDIPALVEAFCRKYSGDELRCFSASAMERLKVAPWKGNARELENVVERALALSDARELQPEDLPLGANSSGAETPDFAQGLVSSAVEKLLTLRELDALYTARILEWTGGNKLRAARILGIDRKTLYRRAVRSARDEETAEGV